MGSRSRVGRSRGLWVPWVVRLGSRDGGVGV